MFATFFTSGDGFRDRLAVDDEDPRIVDVTDEIAASDAAADSGKDNIESESSTVTAASGMENRELAAIPGQKKAKSDFEQLKAVENRIAALQIEVKELEKKCAQQLVKRETTKTADDTVECAAREVRKLAELVSDASTLVRRYEHKRKPVPRAVRYLLTEVYGHCKNMTNAQGTAEALASRVEELLERLNEAVAATSPPISPLGLTRAA